MSKNFMQERLTKDNGEEFSPSRYALKSKNDAIISPYRTYELFFEITFQVIQKLGAYEDIGTPDECREAMETAKACNKQYLNNLNDPLEPIKIASALKSELMKFEYRKEHAPKEISILDYTIMAALSEALDRRTREGNSED